MPGATITRGFLPAFAGKTSGQLFPLLCLAPHGVFRATSLTRKSGGLLPRLFTLTQHEELSVLSGRLSVKSDLAIGPSRRSNAFEDSNTGFRFLYCLLTTPHAGRFIFCDTFRYPGFAPQVPSFSRGMPPFGVRTFLWRETFQPAIACHISDPTIEEERDPARSKNRAVCL
jgi:hypothetical protein